MSSVWCSLSNDANLLQRFEADLREYLAKDYEVDDELVKFVVSSVKEVRDKKQLAAEFNETFEDDAVDVATWCWDKLTELSEQPSAGHADTTEAGLLDELSEEGELAAEQPEGGFQEKHTLFNKSTRQPIKFNLEGAAADTAPIKASSQRSQQLRPHRAAVPASISEPQQQPKPQQESRDPPSKPEASSGAAAALKGAVAAAVRSAAADSRASRDHHAAVGPRGRGRHQEQTPPVGTAAAAAAASVPKAQAAHGFKEQLGDGSRAAVPHREPAARVAGAKRSLVDAAAAGPRNIANRAFQAIKAGFRDDRAAKRQQQQEQAQGTGSRQRQPREDKQRVKQQELQQQQQEHDDEQQQRQQQHGGDEQQQQQQQQDEKRRNRVSVLDRLGSKDSQGDPPKGSSKHSVFERLSGLAPGAMEAQAAVGTATDTAAVEPSVRQPQPNAAAAKQQPHQQSQQLQRQQGIAGAAEGNVPRRSVVHRLEGAGSGAADEQQRSDQQQQRSPKQPVATSTGAPAVQQPAAEPAAHGPAERAATLGTKRKAPVEVSANGGSAALDGAVKKLATAGTAGGKPQPSAELAALRAKLAAKQAEVKLLQQLKALQEADERSVVVFNIAPHVPEAVVRAHFSGCGPIKRCTLLPGHMPGPKTPGAYLQFESNTGVLAAMGLAGSYMLDQQIQVARKSDYTASQQKAKQSYVAALRAQAAVSAKHWTKPVAAPNTAAAASTSAVGGGEAESPTSLGSMGLVE